MNWCIHMPELVRKEIDADWNRSHWSFCPICGTPRPKPVEKKSLAEELHSAMYGTTFQSQWDQASWERVAQRAREILLEVDRERLAEMLNNNSHYSMQHSTIVAERVIEFFKEQAK